MFAATPLPNLLISNCGSQLTTCLVSHDAPLEMTSRRILSREALENELQWLYTVQPMRQHPRAAANALWGKSVAIYGVSCPFLEAVPRCGGPFHRTFEAYEPLNMQGGRTSYSTHRVYADPSSAVGSVRFSSTTPGYGR